MLLCCHIAYTPELLARAEALSLPQRREKADKLSNAQVRAASISAGLLLRYGLHRSGIYDPEIIYSASGKPCLAGGGLYFSLSHSGDYAVCSIETHPVAEDIQKVVTVSERAITRFCTKEEQEYLKRCDDAKSAAISLWALKESYFKTVERSTNAVFEQTFTIKPDKTVCGPKGFEFTLLTKEIPGYIIATCRRL